MSVQVNQYLMYGVKMPMKWADEWESKNDKDFYDTFEKFIGDSAFDNKITEVDGIFCLYDGMNGVYVVIGKVLKKSCDEEYIGSPPLAIPILKKEKKRQIKDSIFRNFGIDEKLKTYLIIHYR